MDVHQSDNGSSWMQYLREIAQYACHLPRRASVEINPDKSTEKEM